MDGLPHGLQEEFIISVKASVCKDGQIKIFFVYTMLCCYNLKITSLLCLSAPYTFPVMTSHTASKWKKETD